MAYRKLSKPLSHFTHAKACKEVKAGILHTWKQEGKNLYSASTTFSEVIDKLVFYWRMGLPHLLKEFVGKFIMENRQQMPKQEALALSSQTWFANPAVPLSSYMTYSKLLNHSEHKAWPVESAYKWQQWWSCHHYHPQETKSSGCKHLKGHYVGEKVGQLSMITINRARTSAWRLKEPESTCHKEELSKCPR